MKRSRAPREVVAQLLEYAAWAKELSDEEIHRIAEAYFQTVEKERTLRDAFIEMFEDEMPVLNRKLRLFVVAEEIPGAVLRVCRFLRTSHGMDIDCLTVSTFQTESGDVLVNTEAKVGDEDIVTPKSARQTASQMPRWSGDKPVRDVVWEAVQEFTRGDTNTTFSPKDISTHILKKYPDFKVSNVGAELTAGCPNHPSYRHHSGNHKYYWSVRRGICRLYNPESDKVEA